MFGTCFLYLQHRYPEWRSEGLWSRSFQESFSHFHPQFLQKYDRKIIAQLNKGLSIGYKICDVTYKINKIKEIQVTLQLCNRAYLQLQLRLASLLYWWWNQGLCWHWLSCENASFLCQAWVTSHLPKYNVLWKLLLAYNWYYILLRKFSMFTLNIQNCQSCNYCHVFCLLD